MNTTRMLVDEYIAERAIPDFDAIAEEHGLREARWLAEGVRMYSLPWSASDQDVEFYQEHLLQAAREWLSAQDAREEESRQNRREPDYPEGRMLDCGHVVYYKTDVMRASLGTVCPECYDDPRWSG